MINFSNEIHSINMIVLIITGILHLIFAGGVAKDAGAFAKHHQQTHLVSPVTWAFATLVGGVFVAAIYWLLHHVAITR